MEIGWTKSTGRAYYSVTQKTDESFARFTVGVRTPQDHNLILSKKKDLLEYTQKQDNRIIEILNIAVSAYTPGMLYYATRYYPDYYPLVFIRECKSLYSDLVFQQCSTRYQEFIRWPEEVAKFYHEVADEMRAFTEATGLYFEDISGNNILVNEDFSDFRIIDVGSLASAPDNYTIAPVAVLLSQKMLVNNWRPKDGNGGDPFFIKYVGNPDASEYIFEQIPQA